jgi:hypothetical protein
LSIFLLPQDGAAHPPFTHASQQLDADKDIEA